MWKVRKILAPTDLSKLSEAGVRSALELAESQGAEVVVYSVVEFPATYSQRPEELSPAAFGTRPVQEILEDRTEKLDRFLKSAFPELLPRVSVRIDVALGTAEENILEKAAQEGVDLVVMSTQGRTGLGRAFMGSVTETIVRRSPCKVLSVSPAAA
jgi:nucleotide-binding universal stress UspA family protein